MNSTDFIKKHTQDHARTRVLDLEILIMKALGWQYYLVKRIPLLTRIIQKINKVEIFVYPDADSFDSRRYVVKKNGEKIGEC